ALKDGYDGEGAGFAKSAADDALTFVPLGAVAGAAGKAVRLARGAKSTGKIAKEGIYEFTDTAGKKYCGQSSNIPNRLKQHQKTGKLDSNQSVQTTEVLGGKTAREIAEHKRIQEITGGVPARFSDKVSNKVDPIGPNRSHLLD
ncbi:MAG: GIY-YIG nuclease family protein, partial [Reinekea sp.]